MKNSQVEFGSLSPLCHAVVSAVALVAILIAPVVAQAALPRFPQAYAGHIVFVADGNLWSVARRGGVALQLTSAPGQDLMLRVSPDGQWIAYTRIDGDSTDVWVIPSSGGDARRLTFSPAASVGVGRLSPDNLVVTWTPDSKSVVYLTKRNQWNVWIQELWKVPVAGGAPEPMPIDSAVSGPESAHRASCAIRTQRD